VVRLLVQDRRVRAGAASDLSISTVGRSAEVGRLGKGSVHPVGDEECPFLDLPGDRENQIVVEGSRDLIGLPTGEPFNPFED
jgi:hypothetical protein